MSDDRISVHLENPTGHPIFVGHQFNPKMGAWEIMVLVGNYKTKADALTDAATIKDALENAIGAKLHRAGN